MKHILISLLLVLASALTAIAQDKSTEQALKDAATRGTPVTVNTVFSDVSIAAVLIPRADARRIFSREIANNYAIVELNIGNKSPDSALLVQGIYIDYSRWALSGSRTTAQAENTAGRFAQYQTSTNRNQVASNEYRIVRGQLLDAQNSTWRNRVVNWLTFAVSLASGFDFSLKETGIKTGFGKAGTIGIPSLKTAWPDTTIEQLKTIDDYGFRTGRNIPRQGSDIIICFFPIDLFLTPTFKQLYLKSPALFFNPLEMLQDPDSRQTVERLLVKDLDDPVPINTLRQRLPCYQKLRHNNPDDPLDAVTYKGCLYAFGLSEEPASNPTKLVVNSDLASRERFKAFVTLDYLDQMSLNNITITLDGVMTIDTSAFAAKIETLTFDKVEGCPDDKSACFWTDTTLKSGVRSGTLSGSYMTSGNVAIAEQERLKLDELTTIAEKSDDQNRHFSFKLTSPVATGEKLTFTVVKSQAGPNGTATKDLKSASKEYVVTYTASAPTIDSAVANDSTITITGKNLADAAGPKISLHTPSGKDLTDLEPSSADANSITIARPADTQPVGCWSVTVAANGKNVTYKFDVAPSVTGAELVEADGKQTIKISGSDLDAKDCQSPAQSLKFQLQKGVRLLDLTPAAGATSTKVTLSLPDKAPKVDTTWTLHVWFGGKDLQLSIPLTQ